MSLKDLGYKPRQVTVRIVLDDTLRQDVDAARVAYAAQARKESAPDQGLGSELPEFKKRLEAAETAADEAAVSFVFQALPRPRLAELIAACPPTHEQLSQWKDEDKNNPLIVIPVPEFDVDTFPPLLIAESLIEPETTADEAVEMWESGDWSDAIWNELWKTAWDKTNRTISTLPTSGIGSAKTQASDPVSPTQ